MLQRLAQSHSDGQRFLALVGGLDKRHSAKGFCNSLMAQRAPESGPGLRGFRRRQSLRCKGDARSKLRRGLAQFAHVLPVNPDDSQQSTQRRLRVAVGWIKIGLQRANRAPCRLVHMQIEAWQNDGAIGRGCDGGDQPRSGRVGSRGTCNNLHACGALCQLRNAAGDKFRLSACAIHAVNCAQIKRPMFAGDCEKVQRDAPIFVKALGREPFQQAPVHVLDDHLVDEIGKIARKVKRLCGRACHQQRLVARLHAALRIHEADGALQAFRPFQNELHQRQPTIKIANGFRHIFAKGVFERGACEQKIVLDAFHRPQRHNGRQHDGAAPAGARQLVA